MWMVLLKNPQTYQSFDPQEVGRKHQFIPGKHSGLKAIAFFLQQEGIELDRNKGDELLKRIRQRAMFKKKSLTYARSKRNCKTTPLI